MVIARNGWLRRAAAALCARLRAHRYAGTGGATRQGRGAGCQQRILRGAQQNLCRRRRAHHGVWSHADDVTYMGPTGGVEHGWSAVLKNWQGQAALKLGGRVEPADMQAVIGRDLAVVTAYEQGENTNADGKVARVKLRATNIFRKEGGQWKMIGHHTDPLPYLAK